MVTKFFGLHDGDTKRAFLMFGYIFIVIATILIPKPLRNSLFITNLGADKLPVAFIFVSLASVLVIGFYTKISNRFTLGRSSLLLST